MSQELDSMPSWVTVVIRGAAEQFHQVPISYWDELDAAYHNWYERHIDRVLSLVALHGADVLFAASQMSDLSTSTPETRAKNRELEAASKAARGFTE